jgi:hypothetical protein
LNPLKQAEGKTFVKFIVNRGIVKMLELIERSPVLQRMIWALISILLIHVIRWW